MGTLFASFLALFVVANAVAPSDRGSPISSELAVLRAEAIARFAPAARADLLDVPVRLAARPLPRTAPDAAACFDVQTGVVTLGADIEARYGRAVAVAALTHEYGHALAWRRYAWDLREFRRRFIEAASVIGAERAYPAFAAFVRRHYAEIFATADYSELFPSVLIELRSASVLPPPLRRYVAALMWP